MEGLNPPQIGGTLGKTARPRLNLPQPRAYKTVRIGDLFDSCVGNVDIQKRDLGDVGIDVVSAGVAGCGVVGKTTKPARCIETCSLTMDMFGNVFVRDTPYVMVTHARVFAMLPKDQRFGRLSLLYISALLSYCRLLYSFSSMATWRGVKDDYISLPVTEEGEIDFAYMENFIREIEASRLYKLDAYLQAAGFASSALTAEEAEALRQMECK
ncbi:MAG: restriction endonuclease subunit S [Candidatus Spyradenecus sp.]